MGVGTVRSSNYLCSSLISQALGRGCSAVLSRDCFSFTVSWKMAMHGQLQHCICGEKNTTLLPAIFINLHLQQDICAIKSTASHCHASQLSTRRRDLWKPLTMLPLELPASHQTLWGIVKSLCQHKHLFSQLWNWQHFTQLHNTLHPHHIFNPVSAGSVTFHRSTIHNFLLLTQTPVLRSTIFFLGQEHAFWPCWSPFGTRWNVQWSASPWASRSSCHGHALMNL